MCNRPSLAFSEFDRLELELWSKLKHKSREKGRNTDNRKAKLETWTLFFLYNGQLKQKRGQKTLQIRNKKLENEKKRVARIGIENDMS